MTFSLVAYWALASVSSVFMDLSQLSPEQFKELVRGIVDDRLRELLGDPDLGLQLGNGLHARLKESLSNRDRLSGEDIADLHKMRVATRRMRSMKAPSTAPRCLSRNETLVATAQALNDRGLPSARGGKWTARSVINVRARLKAA